MGSVISDADYAQYGQQNREDYGDIGRSFVVLVWHAR